MTRDDCGDATVVEFPTTSMEMQAVADRFDRDGDGFIDYKEFITALRPERGEVALTVYISLRGSDADVLIALLPMCCYVSTGICYGISVCLCVCVSVCVTRVLCIKTFC